MGKPEKFCWYMDLMTGAIVWGFTSIFLIVGLIIFYITHWSSKGIEWKMLNKDQWQIIVLLFFLYFLWIYFRFLQGIFQNKPELMATGVLLNLMLMYFVFGLSVYLTFEGEGIAAICLVLCFAFVRHVTFVSHSVYKK